MAETKYQYSPRKQVISEFDEMKIDMDHMLCIPSVHAVFGQSYVVIDFCGGVRDLQGDFPDEKIDLLKKWIALHKDEIQKNHYRCEHSEFPLEPISPWNA